ncbi:hypothetical protein SAMN05421890_3209 [Ensifer adhaerens]|nr:hypothetical protein SAMN05421890_3209 [Ensifer adhaerens]HZG28598.1 hypothetical protein [Ensifer sp.]
MRMRSVALWVLVVLLVALLFYFFRSEMSHETGKQGAMTGVSPALS